MEVNEKRLEILNKIKIAELNKKFDQDFEDDPESFELFKEDIDYTHKKLITKIRTKKAEFIGERLIDKLIKNNQLIIKEVKGIENINKIKGGAFITGNHFHMFENMAYYRAIKNNDKKMRPFYRVIREGNYTNPPKGFEYLFKYCKTLPLSRNKETMKEFYNAIDYYLNKKNSWILIYPEQYMWWNYTKPRPFKSGAFKIAAKYNKPILPIFITMNDSKDYLDFDGLPVKEYTINILEPIYPDPNLSLGLNAKIMMEKNFNSFKEVYESFYNKPLKYEDD